LELIQQNIPRLFSLYDRDSSRESYGVGDRYRWAWGLIDFANGTFQGAAHGIARLLTSNLLPYQITKTSMLLRIDAMFSGTRQIMRDNGSMEEAFPFEGSFCVTALVAYDLLSAIELLKTQLSPSKVESYIEVVRPLISYLSRSEEHHALISNHLATASAALFKWALLTGDDTKSRAKLFLKRILDHQSDEGWYKEYEGADPGYQTLCTYYLADIHRMNPELGLLDSLRRSVKFVWYFAHPDGSFGGLYGSRNTRFYYPGGIEYLAKEIPEAAALAKYMRNSIYRQCVPTLSCMDEPNLVPMFNSYCWAATTVRDPQDTPIIPCQQQEKQYIHWPQAGLFISKGRNHYTMVSTHKGGVVYHFVNGVLAKLDAGVLARNTKGKLLSTQIYQVDNEVSISENELKIRSHLKETRRRLPTPFQFLILRLLNISVMRVEFCRELIKKLLVKYLITGQSRSYGHNLRVVKLGSDIDITDHTNLTKKVEVIADEREFVAIHMASQGYWQIQDDGNISK
jgi:hypothetical protein